MPKVLSLEGVIVNMPIIHNGELNANLPELVFTEVCNLLRTEKPSFVRKVIHVQAYRTVSSTPMLMLIFVIANGQPKKFAYHIGHSDKALTLKRDPGFDQMTHLE